MRCASDRSIELIEIISISDRCGGAPGTMIMVATRRKHGNERPSIISSSVIIRCELPVDTLDTEGMPEMNRFPSRAHGHAGSPANPSTKS